MDSLVLLTENPRICLHNFCGIHKTTRDVFQMLDNRERKKKIMTNAVLFKRLEIYAILQNEFERINVDTVVKIFCLSEEIKLSFLLF